MTNWPSRTAFGGLADHLDPNHQELYKSFPKKPSKAGLGAFKIIWKRSCKGLWSHYTSKAVLSLEPLPGIWCFRALDLENGTPVT